MRRYAKYMREHTWLPKIRRQMAGGEKSGIRSTPGIFLSGRIQDISFGFKSLLDATDAILKAALDQQSLQMQLRNY